MMDILTFCDNHWFLAFSVICCGYCLFAHLIKMPFRIINIALRGWPPAHLDADGDFKLGTNKEEK